MANYTEPTANTGRVLSKEDLGKIAENLVDTLRPYNLPIWQAKETLRFAIDRLEHEPLRGR